MGRGSSKAGKGGGATFTAASLVPKSESWLKKTFKTASDADKKVIKSEMNTRGFHFDESAGKWKKNKRQGYIS